MTSLITKSEIKEWGNSLGVRIPKKVIDALNLHDGSQINVLLDGNKIVLEPQDNPFFDLSKDVELSSLTAKITAKNKHSGEEFDDESVGNEVW
jgi:antitoxin MazE